jgi:hypothetical protein
MANKPEEFPVFTDPDLETMRQLMEKIPLYLKNVVSVLGIKSSSEIIVNQEILYDLLTRVEKRRVYFHIYYDKKKMGERNEGALICFWILKLMPFKHATIPNALLNTKIAYTFFINMLFYEAAKTKRRVNIKSDLLNNTLYAFQYRDLSKEAIMALAESYLY